MRLSILVYGVLYVVLEMVGQHLETVGWGRITPLDVASALVDALLVIVVAIAVLVLHDVTRERWAPVFRAWQRRQLRAAETAHEPIGVTSWRTGPQEVPRALAAIAPRRAADLPAGWAAPDPDYGVRPVGRPFPEEPGRLL